MRLPHGSAHGGITEELQPMSTKQQSKTKISDLSNQLDIPGYEIADPLYFKIVRSGAGYGSTYTVYADNFCPLGLK